MRSIFLLAALAVASNASADNSRTCKISSSIKPQDRFDNEAKENVLHVRAICAQMIANGYLLPARNLLAYRVDLDAYNRYFVRFVDENRNHNECVARERSYLGGNVEYTIQCSPIRRPLTLF